MKVLRICAIVIAAICILLLCFINTSWYLELKLDYYRNCLESSFSNHSALYSELAVTFTDSPDQPYYLREGASVCITPYIQEQITNIQTDCTVEIDSIFIADYHDIEYPFGACVFSTTVERGDFIYAWVELVFSTESVEQLYLDYEEALKNRFVIPLSENWYIMTHYGY